MPTTKGDQVIMQFFRTLLIFVKSKIFFEDRKPSPKESRCGQNLFGSKKLIFTIWPSIDRKVNAQEKALSTTLVRMCIQLTRLTFICEVARYHCVQIRQHLSKYHWRKIFVIFRATFSCKHKPPEKNAVLQCTLLFCGCINFFLFLFFFLPCSATAMAFSGNLGRRHSFPSILALLVVAVTLIYFVTNGPAEAKTTSE